jgi:hypothetical protein
MNTIVTTDSAKMASTTTILAIDLSKYKCVACGRDQAMDESD